jgi:two-component system alkaline phosphatase synthesis response regulator PhoP
MSKQRILIVDDDADVVESVSSFLEANGYQVLKAHDGREGLKQAKLERPDLIIMDIMMNERTEGFFTVQAIRRTAGLESVPIFVLSSLYEQVPGFRIPPDSGWMAHDQFFHKPVNMPELRDKIRRFLTRSDQ